MSVTLDAERVEAIIHDCLFRPGEPQDNPLKVDGIMGQFGFHRARLAAHKDEIVAMLAELPDAFQEKKGGGYTFLNLCDDRHGNQWTGFHKIMEALVVLGIGVRRVQYNVPRPLWTSLPMGMPYIVVLEADRPEGTKDWRELPT